MTDDIIWKPLHDALARFTAAGRAVSLWFRDDDAIEPTAQLDRLLELGRRHDLPLTLAVIPSPTGEPLVDRLAGESRIAVAVHGWTHHNHSPDPKRKQELGLDRRAEVVVEELRQGFDKLKALYLSQFVSMLVPPWNRIAPELIPPLPAFGYRALSVYGPARANQALTAVNTHVDIIDWHGTRGGRPQVDLVRELTRELDRRFEGSDEPIGLLSHHLVHDDAAWSFLSRLFDETVGHPAIRWRPVSDFFA